MKEFEKPSMDECQNLVHRLHGKTIEEMIAMLGPPVRERGPKKEEYLADGVPETIEIRRSFVFHDVGPTIRTLIIRERMDGKFEYRMQGKEITKNH